MKYITDNKKLLRNKKHLFSDSAKTEVFPIDVTSFNLDSIVSFPLSEYISAVSFYQPT